MSSANDSPIIPDDAMQSLEPKSFDHMSVIEALGTNMCKFAELRVNSDNTRAAAKKEPLSDEELLEAIISINRLMSASQELIIEQDTTTDQERPPRAVFAPVAVEETHNLMVNSKMITKTNCGPGK